jgi:hypothetical protein
MSIQAMSAAFEVQGLSPSEKVVLLALANYADEKNRCWPSQKRLAEMTGLTDRWVRKILSTLETRGFLTREKRCRDDGSQTSDVFQLRLTPPELTSGGAELSSGGGRNSVPGGAELSSYHDTSEEPSVRTNISLRSSASEPVGFTEFWLAYPRKVGKLAAMRRFRDACKRIGGPDPPAVLLDALARVKPTWTEPRFIPHPATWLHQGRWEDEVETRKSWAELLAEDVA